MFNPTRLTLARQRRGWTKKQLAENIGVSTKAVSTYEKPDTEKSRFAPSEETVEKIAKALDFPKAFFFGDTLETIEPEMASFRSLRSMKAYQRDMARSAGSIAIAFSDWVETKFDLPQPQIPTFEAGIDPESAAMAVRHEWGLYHRSIKNMVHLLEAKGVKVFSLDIDAKEVDAFSTWANNKPFVFLNTGKTAERSRFDAAHELGHLVLHRRVNHSKGNQELEKEADQFASAFLMPENSIYAKAPKFITVAKLVELKKFWGVSVAALNFRLHQLGLTSEWVNRSIFIELSKLGYRSSEPEPMQHERSQIIDKVFSSLREEGMTRADVAQELNIKPKEFSALFFGLAMTEVTERKNSDLISQKPEIPKAFKLRLAN